MNLRFADEHDAAACLAIYAQYIDTSITFETALPSEDEFAGRIRSYGAVYPWLIAEEDGEILGYLGILISFDESEITNVCVAEKARRRGIGRALMEELFRRMQERKVRVIHLDVRIGNTPARNLYESLGFVQDGLRKGYYDLPKEDAVLMSRTDESVPKR